MSTWKNVGVLALVLLVVLVAPVSAAKPQAGPPVDGTLELVNEPTIPGHATFNLTWNRHVKYPAFWLDCYQGGIIRYAQAREPVPGDGSATIDIGIPGAYWWPTTEPVVCEASLHSYDVKWKPVTILREIVTLDAVTFEARW